MSNVPEIWKPVAVEPYGEVYEVSNLGQVRRTVYLISGKAGRLLRPSGRKDGSGYQTITLSHKGARFYGTVHSLVAIAFLGPRPENMQINHKDGNKRNNALTNLEYLSPSENKLHALDLGVDRGRGETHGMAKLTLEAVLAIRLLEGKMSKRAIGRAFGVCHGQVMNIQAGKSWKY